MSRFTQQDMKDDSRWEARFDAIAKEAEHILQTEGANTVRGVHFAQAGDAYMARMIEAEQVVAKRDASMDGWIATPRARAAS